MLAQIINREGKTFTVRLVQKGTRYGLKHCLTHDKDEPMVEFYDADYDFDRDDEGNVLGQFVTRYYLKTLLDKAPGTGLCLDGGVPVWSIDARAFAAVAGILQNWSNVKGGAA